MSKRRNHDAAFKARVALDGSLAVRIEPPKAMISYVIDHLRLRPADHSDQSVPIRLRNYDTIREFDRVGAVG